MVGGGEQQRLYDNGTRQRIECLRDGGGGQLQVPDAYRDAWQCVRNGTGESRGRLLGKRVTAAV